MPLDSEEDWQMFFQGSFTRARTGIYQGRFEPIAGPQIFNKSFIRILAQSPGARRTWWLAGTLIQEIGFGMEFQRWKIPIGVKSVIKVEYSDKYRLRFFPVPWLMDLLLQIDVYTGEEAGEAKVEQSTEELLDLTSQLENLIDTVSP
jgi:hypothetical protein